MKKSKTGLLSIIALIIAIISIIISFFPFLGIFAWIPALIGLIMGVIALVVAFKNDLPKGIAIAAIVLSLAASYWSKNNSFNPDAVHYTSCDEVISALDKLTLRDKELSSHGNHAQELMKISLEIGEVVKMGKKLGCDQKQMDKIILETTSK